MTIRRSLIREPGASHSTRTAVGSIIVGDANFHFTPRRSYLYTAGQRQAKPPQKVHRRMQHHPGTKDTMIWRDSNLKLTLTANFSPCLARPYACFSRSLNLCSGIRSSYRHVNRLAYSRSLQIRALSVMAACN